MTLTTINGGQGLVPPDNQTETELIEMANIQVKIVRPTFVRGTAVQEGEIVDVSRQERDTLISTGLAERYPASEGEETNGGDTDLNSLVHPTRGEDDTEGSAIDIPVDNDRDNALYIGSGKRRGRPRKKDAVNAAGVEAGAAASTLTEAQASDAVTARNEAAELDNTATQTAEESGVDGYTEEETA